MKRCKREDKKGKTEAEGKTKRREHGELGETRMRTMKDKMTTEKQQEEKKGGKQRARDEDGGEKKEERPGKPVREGSLGGKGSREVVEERKGLEGAVKEERKKEDRDQEE